MYTFMKILNETSKNFPKKKGRFPGLIVKNDKKQIIIKTKIIILIIIAKLSK